MVKSVDKQSEEVLSSIKNIDEQIKKLQEDKIHLYSKLDSAWGNVLLTQKLLSGTVWTIKVSKRISLECSEKSKATSKVIEMQRELSDIGDIEIEPNIWLGYNDYGYLTLSIDDISLLSGFISKHRIIIDGPELSAQLKHLKKDVVNLEKICHICHIKG